MGCSRAAAALWAAGMAALLTLVVGALPGVLAHSDVRFAGIIAGWPLPDVLRRLGTVGQIETALVLALAVLALAHRCIVLCVTYLAAVIVGFLVTYVLQEIIQRDQPLGVWITGRTTFPSTAVAQAVIVAGLVPLAVRVATRRAAPAHAVALLLAFLALATAVVAVHDRRAWPSDVVAGALIGLAAVFGGRWVIDHRGWHRPCHACPWAPEQASVGVGLLTLSDEWDRALQRIAITGTLVLAGVLTVLAVRVGIPQDPEGAMLGADIAEAVQIGLLVVMVLGALVAFRWPAVGATVLALAGIGLAILSAGEYEPVVAVVIGLAVLVPAFLLWLAWQRTARTAQIWRVALVTTAALAVVFLGASHLYQSFFGPTHPASALPLLPVHRVAWAWSGGLTQTGATVVARLDYGADRARLEVRPRAGGPAVRSAPVPVPSSRVVRLPVVGLEPGTAYRWRVVVDGALDTERGHGRFSTPIAGPQSFTVVAGSCARTGSDGRVYDAMRAERPDLVLFTGDLHYQNIESNDVDAFLGAYDRVLTQPAPAALLRSAPAAYVWDDHDYGPNDADASSASRPAARAAYRLSVPYARLGPAGPPTQAFTVGRVRFILTDARSHRTPTTILGARQTEWFLDELVRASRTHALVVWVNSVPWIGDARPGADGWAGHPDERRRIADTIAAADIANLVMVAGDAHMVAIDDGTNSGYATGGGGGFPILHAAALDRPGDVKGGPYSEGAFPGGGQYGVLRVRDEGGTLTVGLAGHTWEGETLVEYRFTPR